MRRILKIVGIVLGVIAVLFLALVIYRVPAAFERDKTEKAVAKIQARKLQLKDVTGEHLPPEPSATEKDATVAGVDANSNGIRDDVELGIFKLHPESARIRAAELQYAMALQMELTEVFNSETLIAAIRKGDKAISCISETIPKARDQNTPLKEIYSLLTARRKEVEDLAINNEDRKNKKKEVFKYLTTYGSSEGPTCNLDLASFSD